MLLGYTGIIYHENNQYHVEFPDMPGICGRAHSIEGVIKEGRVQAQSYIDVLVETNQPIPEMTPANEIIKKNNGKGKLTCIVYVGRNPLSVPEVIDDVFVLPNPQMTI